MPGFEDMVSGGEVVDVVSRVRTLPETDACRTCEFGRIAAQAIADSKQVPIDEAMERVIEVCGAAEDALSRYELPVAEDCPLATMTTVQEVLR